MDLNQWPKDLPATEGRTNVIEVIPGVEVWRDGDEAVARVDFLLLERFLQQWKSAQPRDSKHTEKLMEGLNEWFDRYPPGHTDGLVAFLAVHAGCDQSTASRFVKRMGQTRAFTRYAMGSISVRF